MPRRIAPLALLISAALIASACSPAPIAATDEPTEAPTDPPTAIPTETPTAVPTPSEPGETRTDAFGVIQVYVPAGCFMMGADPAVDPIANRFSGEQPAHETCLTSGYWIDQTEVTNASFQAFVDAGGYEAEEYWSEQGWEWVSRQNIPLPRECENDSPEMPRACVTWYEAEAYATWRGGRLPTEAEWEYAARGPESLIYPWGSTFDETLLNLAGSRAAMPVGSYPDGASWVGALDMSGNLMEWVQDWYSTTYYAEAPRDDPAGPETGERKVERGGWFGANEQTARATYRHHEDPPTYGDHHIGFRVVTPIE